MFIIILDASSLHLNSTSSGFTSRPSRALDSDSERSSGAGTRTSARYLLSISIYLPYIYQTSPGTCGGCCGGWRRWRAAWWRRPRPRHTCTDTWRTWGRWRVSSAACCNPATSSWAARAAVWRSSCTRPSSGSSSAPSTSAERRIT